MENHLWNQKRKAVGIMIFKFNLYESQTFIKNFI